MPMNPEAAQALADLIHEYGKSIVKMPSSCQIYMSAALADYPDEKELLLDALRRGIPDRILEHAGEADYPAQLDSMTHEIARGRGIDPELATEVVTAWSEALNRPVGYQKSEVPLRVYPSEPKPDPRTEQTLKLIMALIVGVGGFLGAALGAGLASIIFKTTALAVDGMPNREGQRALTVVAIAIAIKMGIAGTLGGIAALTGWIMGRGDEKPWSTFAAAFGSGFTMAMILLSFSASLLRMIIIAVCIFGATYTSAYRGGYKV